jgi:homogentisate 1,2-dioxygenase
MYRYGCSISMNQCDRRHGTNDDDNDDAKDQEHHRKDDLAKQQQQPTKRKQERYLYNADGEFLIVPQTGSLHVWTELGRFVVHPTEIVVVPRGIVFQVNLAVGVNNTATTTTTTAPSAAAGGDASTTSAAGSTRHTWPATGYVLEVYHGSFQLPELGPIGSNGLANARDFLYPTAFCVSDQKHYRTPCTILCKMHAQLFSKSSTHSPFNVVAWHGNYLPYKYDLKRFCAVNSVTYDHMDPSIYTVLTCPSDHPGTALADFVLFPPKRILATDSDTFRPPWFHRNTMSEFMGLIFRVSTMPNKARGSGPVRHRCTIA